MIISLNFVVQKILVYIDSKTMVLLFFYHFLHSYLQNEIKSTTDLNAVLFKRLTNFKLYTYVRIYCICYFRGIRDNL